MSDVWFLITICKQVSLHWTKGNHSEQSCLHLTWWKDVLKYFNYKNCVLYFLLLLFSHHLDVFSSVHLQVSLKENWSVFFKITKEENLQVLGLSLHILLNLVSLYYRWLKRHFYRTLTKSTWIEQFDIIFLYGAGDYI